jgi:hypothetical protein
MARIVLPRIADAAGYTVQTALDRTIESGKGGIVVGSGPAVRIVLRSDMYAALAQGDLGLSELKTGIPVRVAIGRPKPPKNRFGLNGQRKAGRARMVSASPPKFAIVGQGGAQTAIVETKSVRLGRYLAGGDGGVYQCDGSKPHYFPRADDTPFTPGKTCPFYPRKCLPRSVIRPV